MGHERHHEHEHSHDRVIQRGMRGARERFGDPRDDRGGWGRGRRMRSADIRRAILVALRETPAHGYEVMRRLEEMSSGLWRPSPGSIYPHLQLLEDEGMVKSVENNGTRTFTLTKKGAGEAAGDMSLPWESNGDGDDPVRVSIPTASRPTIRLVSDRTALEVLWRHVGMGGDDAGFLPCLRRGVPVPADKVSELVQALNRLELDHRGASVLDRRMAHALHRLALESQVLLTDAWPGVFDDPMIAAIRSVQEAVERILSDQDIRYYPTSS